MKISKVKKYLVILVLILSQLSLMGVGFSSWLFCIGSNKELDVEDKLYADDVFDSLPYVSMNTSKGDNHTGITSLHYNSYGFVYDDTVTYTTYAKYYLIFRFNEFYEDYAKFDSSNLLINLSLKDQSASLFNYLSTSGSSISYVIGNDSSYSSGLKSFLTPPTFSKVQSGSNTNNIFAKLSLNEFNRDVCSTNYVGKYMFLEISYCFSTDSNSYKNLYNDINGKNISLLFNVSIEGVKSNEA